MNDTLPTTEEATAKTPAIDTGGPAFPTEVGFGSDADFYQTGPSTAHFYGMTLRDYFAAKAMQGILSVGTINESGDTHSFAFAEDNRLMWNSRGHVQDLARMCFQMADAMIAARKAPAESGPPAPCRVCGGGPGAAMHSSKYNASEVGNQHEYEGRQS